MVTTEQAKALLHAIYTSPEDDAPRAVYADLLSSHADKAQRVRGEFITLQLHKDKRRLTKEEKARETALLRANKMTWLGPLADLVFAKGLAYERGFPSRLALRHAVGETYRRAAGDPAWRTLRVINAQDTNVYFRGEFISLVSDPALFGLRELVNVKATIMPAFVSAAPRRLTRFVTTASTFPDGFLNGEGLPRLHTFGIQSTFGEKPDWLPLFFRSPLGQRIKRFELAHPPGPIYRDWAPALMKTNVESFKLSATRNRFQRSTFSYEGTRDGDGFRLKATYVPLGAAIGFEHIVEMVEGQHAQISSLELKTPKGYVPDPAILKALKAALKETPLSYTPR